MKSVLAVLTAAVLLVGCAGGPQEEPTAAPTSAGHDDTGVNAQESADPVTRLVLTEADTGATVVFDAGAETETPLGQFGPTVGVSGDGRFAYLRGDAGLTIVDAGSWTFDHGDHSHYYVMPPGVAGTVEHHVAGVNGQRDLTAALRADGTVELLDRDRLGDHQVSPADGFGDLRDVAEIAPFGDDLVLVTRAGVVRQVGSDGVTQDLGECAGVTGTVTVSGAIIFGCGDGAVKVAKRAGKLTAEPMPFGNTRPTAELGPLTRRYGGNELAGIAGDQVWVLDSRRGTWASVLVPGVVAVNTVSGDSVLALTADGRLRAFDITTGAETAAVELFGATVPTDRPVIEIDGDRAYVNDATARAVYEIDYADALRVARTLKVGIAPGFMVETGR